MAYSDAALQRGCTGFSILHISCLHSMYVNCTASGRLLHIPPLIPMYVDFQIEFIFSVFHICEKLNMICISLDCKMKT